ncbi:DNA helicase [Tanacetum coccineum]
MSQAGADNLVNDGSIERDIPISEEIVTKRETPSVDVQIVENDGSVGRRISTKCHDVVPTTMVPVSRIFDRFRNICFNNVGSDCMSQTRLYSSSIVGTTMDGDHQIRTATVENAGDTTSYMDLGDCDQECRHCGCVFWYNERLKGKDYGGRAEYNLCCGGGKIYMPPMPDPPVFIQQLLTNSNFIDHDEVANRIRIFQGRDEDTLNPEIVEGLIHGGGRGYELPTSDILGGIIFEDGPNSQTDFDVIIEFRGSPAQRINKLHQSYMSLQFPLLFIFGEPGFYQELVLKPRDGTGGRLFQQYVVAVFCVVEQNRLDWVHNHQNDLHSDYLLGLYDAVSHGDREGIQAGSKIMLPRTFTEGPRYMYSHYLDALAIFVYTIEFQKRGLPHCHTLLWVDSSSKIRNAVEIDEYISAEIPDPVEDPKGYKVVTELMMHGPCGVANSSASCTENGVCKKNFSKKYNKTTFFDVNGHTHYRRRQTEVYFMKGESRLDNCNMVPYNRMLCLAFHTHINVEYCGWSMLIKYLFKYISKGPDRIIAKVNRSIGDTFTSTGEKDIQVDEIQNYVDGCFICPFEACWRIFEFPIHCREPAVQILNVHLENAQRVTFRERDRIDIIVNMPEKKKTTLTEWYVYNNENTNGRHLTYLDFPSEFLWYPNSKSWRRRVMKTKKSLGRLSYVHPNSGELFYFWMLLSHQKGCKSPNEVRTVNGYVFPTYRAACEALSLLGDDKEWDIALDESIVSASSAELRTLFAQILIYCDVSNPLKLWTKYWKAMKDDIPAKVSEATSILNFYVNTPELQGYILYELEAILNGFGKSVKDFGLPPPPEHLLKDLRNKLLIKERNYKRDLLMQDTAHFLPQLNHDQKEIYNLIISASKESRQKLLFVYGHGIASLLLPAGRTTHFRFKLLLDLTDESVCHAKKHSWLANLLIETDLIIWDEAPMNNRRCFEALDRTLRDLMNAPEIVFGGKTVVLGGDFRQTLLVKKGAVKEEFIYVSITQSYLCSHFKICKLKENMRLLRTGLSYEERERFEIFSKWLLDVGNDEIGKPDENNDEDTSWITILQQYCLTPIEQGLSELIDFIYDDATLKAPTAFKSAAKTYLSREEAIPMGGETSETELLYPIEYLNTLTFLGFPPYELQLKVINKNVSSKYCIFETWTRKLRSRSESVPEMDFQKYSTDDTTSALLYSNRQRGKESEFPEHHFKFTAYNQLQSKIPYRNEDSKMVYLILTDYLGCIRSISDVLPSEDANIGQKYRRKVDIESLDGNVVELTMWDDLAKQFKKDEIEQLPRPIIIAVSSCRVSKYRDVQLDTTSATFYYINPQTKEAVNAYKMFKEKYEFNRPLQVHIYRYVDPEQEKTRNRQTLHTLLQQDLTSFKCNKASTKRSGVYVCEDHEKQEPPTYRYNFKATITDATATAEFTFFTEAGEKIRGHPCSHLMEKFETTDKTQLPVEMVNIVGKKHIFQIQFAPSTQKGAGRFIVNDVLDIKSTVEKTNIGLMINESTNKDKGVDIQSSIGMALTTDDSINEDKSIPDIQ